MRAQEDRWYDLVGHRVSRRDFVKVTRDLTACLALGSLPAVAQEREPRFRSHPFTLGVASGDPLPNGVVLWTRLDPSSVTEAGAVDSRLAVRWEVADDEGFRRGVRKGSSLATRALGYSVHAEVEGLRPGREYWYRFTAGGQVSAIGRTRTAPATTASPARFRFAFVSCQNYEQGYFTAYRRLASEDLDLVVHLGDYIYERRFGQMQVRQHEAGEVFTLDQYRGRYALYRSDPDLQAAHAMFPWVVTPDDHEVANNYAGAIAEDNQPPEQLLLRRAAAYQAYYEFMPLRRSSMPVGPAMKLFRRLRLGDLVEFHVLDTRQYRSDQSCGDGRKAPCADVFGPDRTMMGAEQERWLTTGLRASRARWNVIANQVMLAEVAQVRDEVQIFSMDKWDGYVDARRRLLNVLAQAKPGNPVVITGDIHSNWVADLKLDFRDLSSPVVGTEFVGTSITSGGDGTDAPAPDVQALNPHVKFFNARRGYVRVTITPALWTTNFRVLPYVSRPEAPIETRATFVVENGRPGAQAS